MVSEYEMGWTHIMDLTPRLRKQFSHRCGSHLREESSTVDATEVGDVAVEIQLVCNNCQTRSLQHSV